MEVLVLTVFLSLLLGTLFTYLFYRDWQSRKFSSAERESLLPLDDEREERRSSRRGSKSMRRAR